MTKLSARAQKAIEILANGGHFWVGDDRGYHGQPAVVYELYEAGRRFKVKGFGISTMREIEHLLDRKQDKFGFDHGVYKLAQLGA